MIGASPSGLPNSALLADSGVVPVITTEEALAAARRVMYPGFCVRCIKRLKSSPDHYCRRASPLRKCDYCVRVKKPCKVIPRRYRAGARELFESPRDGEFQSRAARFADELKEYFRRRLVSESDHARAVWSLNRNVFRLLTTINFLNSQESLPDSEEAVAEVTFQGNVYSA